MVDLKTKKVIIIGDRDGVPGEAIKLCAESAGAEVVYAATNALSEQAQEQWTWKTKSESRI